MIIALGSNRDRYLYHLLVYLKLPVGIKTAVPTPAYIPEEPVGPAPHTPLDRCLCKLPSLADWFGPVLRLAEHGEPLRTLLPSKHKGAFSRLRHPTRRPVDGGRPEPSCPFTGVHLKKRHEEEV